MELIHIACLLSAIAYLLAGIITNLSSFKSRYIMIEYNDLISANDNAKKKKRTSLIAVVIVVVSSSLIAPNLLKYEAVIAFSKILPFVKDTNIAGLFFALALMLIAFFSCRIHFYRSIFKVSKTELEKRNCNCP